MNFRAPMRARRTDESHRVATPLELFFDLCFVVAVAQAALLLHHSVAEQHLGHGAWSYLMVFFALGEVVASATVAVRTGLDADGGAHLTTLASLAVAGLVIVFALWWLYFDRSAHGLLGSLRMSMLWGYGHFLIFAAAAAVGAGLGVVVDFDTRHTDIDGRVAGFAVAVPVAVFLLVVWVLHIRPQTRGAVLLAYPGIAVLILLTPLGPAPVHVIAVLLAALVLVTRLGGRIDLDRKQ